MYLEKLSLVNFKNYEEANLDLHNNVNCFVGNNGVGKTNLLDAIYYLCMCKSYFHSSDNYTIRHNADFMVIQGIYNHNGNLDELHCGFKRGKKKQFRRNKKEYQRLSDHIGQYPVVMVSPSDSALITEGSEERRRYMNSVISQYNREYLEQTIQYNKLLTQRNKLLKEMAGYSGSAELLEVYDDQLAPLGTFIHQKRSDFVAQLTEVFKKYYAIISGGNEQVELGYHSQLNESDFQWLIKQSFSKDRIVQHTSVGIHKDDLELKMNDLAIKKIGSQGQQKTFLVALKLAQFDFLKQVKGLKPLLLLDDIFDKFDVDRVKHLIELVSKDSFGQIFITHTNEERMRNLLKDFHGSYNLYKVDKEVITILDV